SFRKGDRHALGKLKRKTNGWFFSTEKLSLSKDTRRHVDTILAGLEGKAGSIKELHLKGCQIDIVTYWVSTGQGGPWLTAAQMVNLGALGIDLWYDIYSESTEE